MNKENVATGELSELQRARISQNFRAAKALLARKRPRDITDSPNRFPPKNGDVKRLETPLHLSSTKRLPLSEIPTNTPSPLPIKGMKLIDGECNSALSFRGISVNKTTGILSATTMGVAMENGTVLNSYETPVRRPEHSDSSRTECKSVSTAESTDGKLTEMKSGVTTEGGSRLDYFVTPIRQLDCSSLSESSTLSSILDESFDESIFQEIDALCERKSAITIEKEGRNSNFQMDSQAVELSGREDNTNKDLGVFKELGKNEILDSSDDQECEPARSTTSEPTQIGNMKEEYAKYMQSLNDRQREAACSDISTPLMIVAGPGSGKTSTMVGRILMLLNEGIGPSHILAMTFTTAAASEMRDRIGAVAGKTIAKELLISTFHSFSLQLCRSHAEKLSRTPEFFIYGNGQQRKAIIEAVRLLENGKGRQNDDAHNLGEESNTMTSPQHFKEKSKKWQKFVTQAKASGKTPEDCCKTGDEEGAAVLHNYNDILRSCNALDYHDLISSSVKVLTDFPEVLNECRESWKAVVIDEFQDTSSMQYGLLRILASHKRITIVGDEDQSIFSFNGADISGFDSFRKDFPDHKEIRLNKNYRSTRYIVEAASCLIKNNLKRCQLKNVLTDNSCGSKITVKECYNEDAQCAFVVDKILGGTSDGSSTKCSFGNVAVLYRRQVSGKLFQTAFRDRKIPFNIHGVAFYRKKVVRAIIAMLRTALPGCDDGPFRQTFKALLPFDKEEKKRVIGHIDKILTTRKCSYISAARDIFGAKISGTFKRSQLTQGRKVLSTVDVISKLVYREESISAVITSVANMIPQKYLLEQRAVLDVDGGKLLNEDNDVRPVLQYLLDDVSEFLSSEYIAAKEESNLITKEKGCVSVLKAFVVYITDRERENFRSRRHENEDSVTLTTIHQSKGLEWDTVFIVKANESEIPLLHEFNGVTNGNSNSVEEERRLLYVAMTRARKKLFILHVLMDSNWQMLQPSRFLREIPDHLRETQDDHCLKELETRQLLFPEEAAKCTNGQSKEKESSKANGVPSDSVNVLFSEVTEESRELTEMGNGNSFLRRFSVEDRAVVSHLFHQWAKKAAFQNPKRLLDKVAFVIDERLRVKKSTHKDVLRALKSCLRCDEAFQYAEYVLRWEQIPADKRAHIMREKQEHFQKLRIENAMGSSAATSKQIAYLQSLGCTVVPTSRLHASRLIEQYKSL